MINILEGDKWDSKNKKTNRKRDIKRAECGMVVVLKEEVSVGFIEEDAFEKRHGLESSNEGRIIKNEGYQLM